MSRARETEYGKGDDDRTEDRGARDAGYKALDWLNDPEGDKRQEERERKARAAKLNEGLFDVLVRRPNAPSD